MQNRYCISGKESNLVLWIDGHFEDEFPQGHLADVDPLAVDVGVVDVLATSGNALGWKQCLLRQGEVSLYR